ncbi:hypothetical protein [Pectobacterium aquaticum]|uniref:hypothetical protein n=1 Tax=Pectobacterium aquaticum TaxID=2204145 RepID=UPI000E265124|nr:hypothetical protein [Pectobacterium aquaticum]MCH5049418.1 hypothetical protein [Pectobacterium aquaticum]RRO08849.1 hypothetical protein DMB81_007115 [Pectobacterium aquaticum]
MNESNTVQINTHRKDIIDQVEVLIAEKVRKGIEIGHIDIDDDSLDKTLRLLLLSNAFDDDEWISWVIDLIIERELEKIKAETAIGGIPALTEALTAYSDYSKIVSQTSKLMLNKIKVLNSDISLLKGEVAFAPKKLASLGGRAKRKKFLPLKTRALEIYKSRNWASTRQAAMSMQQEIIELAKKENIPLSHSNAWESIQKWIPEMLKRENKLK